MDFARIEKLLVIFTFNCSKDTLSLRSSLIDPNMEILQAKNNRIKNLFDTSLLVFIVVSRIEQERCHTYESKFRYKMHRVQLPEGNQCLYDTSLRFL